MTVAGWRLPAGATLAPCSLLVHRRPEVYPQPTVWQVDRFLDERPALSAWLPFGGGVRRCVGAAFAQFEGRTVLDERSKPASALKFGALRKRQMRRATRRAYCVPHHT
jgi:cytochrome P450